MRVGNFTLLIAGGRERSTGHVEMAHGSLYRVQLINHHHDRRCDAEVTVDGKPVGCFRVDSGQKVEIETPPDDAGRGCFTFFAADSDEGRAAEAGGVSRDDRGLIQVKFKPEKHRQPTRFVTTSSLFGAADGPQLRSEYAKGLGCFPSTTVECGNVIAQNCAAGVTGLTGRSEQTFHNVATLDYDPSGETTISVRLVVGAGVRPLKAARPLSNPVPGPV